ncbi:hypothetical protein [Streptomyces sp. KR55]|uniref:hypothetical protein n=1 Tax=Streptomyces sp. KR55 TaxID=3457425 RepID=UPI003FCFC08B
MPETKAEITIKGCTDHGWFERRIFGWAWWWQAYIPFGSQRSGFARTKEKARAKAEAAARDLAAKENAPYERYKYEVTDADA